MEKHEMAQMMEQMLARMEAKWKAERKADHEEMMARMDVMHKNMLAGMDASYMKMTAWLMDTNDNREGTMACQETMEARLEGQGEPASEDTTLEVAHEQEVALEDAAVIPVRGLRKQRMGRKQAAG
jgi:hypothetical protein